MHRDTEVHRRICYPNLRARKSFHGKKFLLHWDPEDKEKIAKPRGMMRKKVAQSKVSIGTKAQRRKGDRQSEELRYLQCTNQLIP